MADNAPETSTQAYAEILQEVRVAQTALQFLLGFLMAVAVTPRFDTFSQVARGIYVIALVTAFGAVGLLTAPAAFHRVVTDPCLKHRLVRTSSKLALWGLVLLMVAMAAAVLLVLDVVLDLPLALGLAVGVFCWLLGFWFVMPFWQRYRQARRVQNRADGGAEGLR
ncbi:DUF6328 family protein [Streptomyces sp. NPDC000410]|uniref:DUF6328 family protein n=1 Tax=Streptomyces sp. NPDC000410 TaxID=3154254 RepID=UPI00332571C3